MDKFGHEGGESKERMVEATRISTVFNDAKVLEGIADKLMSRGLISGFSIEPIASGYVYEGDKVIEDQFSLNILLAEQDETKAEEIRALVSSVIGEKWDVPRIEQETVSVNEKFLGFVRRAEIEHVRYRREHRNKLVLAVAFAAGMLGLVSESVKNYGEHKAKIAIAGEREATLKKLSDIQEKLADQIAAVEGKLSRGEELTETATDMGAGGQKQELYDMILTVREAEKELLKTIKSEAEQK